MAPIFLWPLFYSANMQILFSLLTLSLLLAVALIAHYTGMAATSLYVLLIAMLVFTVCSLRPLGQPNGF